MDTKPVQPEVPLARRVHVPRAFSPRVGRWTRFTLLLVGAGLTAVFTIAVLLNPYNPDGTPRTMATHTQTGLPPCNFVVLTGKPCPSCGMTTSFALLVRGDVAASLRANWVGTILAVVWAVLLVWSVASGLAGRTLFIPRGWGEVVLTTIVGTFLVLMPGRWGAVLLGG
jgi:hypothetical protein